MKPLGHPARESAFSRDGLIGRVAPFALGAVAALALAPFQEPGPTGRQLLIAWIATVIPVAAALMVPWSRLPQWTEVLPPLSYFVAVAAFEGAFGGVDLEFDALILIPILWVALYGRTPQLLVVVTLAGGTLLAGVIRAPDAVRQSELVVAVVLGLVIGAVGVVVHRLVVRIERQKDEARSVISTAWDAFVAIDTAGTITEWSPRAEAVFGWRRDEAIGRALETTLVPPDLRDIYHAELPRAVAGESGWIDGRRFEFEALHRTGTRMPVEIAVSSSQAEGALRLNIFLRDITRRKQFERDREQMLDRERDAREAFELQNVRLQELDDLRNEFVSLTSHELRTPLHAILGYCELLIDEGELAGDQITNLQVIHRNASRLMRLSDDLLVIAHVSADHDVRIAPAPTRLDQVAADAVEAARPTAAERNIAITCALEPVLLQFGDAARLAQVTDNLLSNAVKFSRPDGEIRVGVHASEDAAVLEVCDDGSGLDPDAVGKAFDRFYRAPDAISRGVPGSGLGLTVVKRIVDAHGGTVSMTSTPGAGTTVRVALPLAGPSSDLA